MSGENDFVEMPTAVEAAASVPCSGGGEDRSEHLAQRNRSAALTVDVQVGLVHRLGDEHVLEARYARQVCVLTECLSNAQFVHRFFQVDGALDFEFRQEQLYLVLPHLVAVIVDQAAVQILDQVVDRFAFLRQ